MGTVSNEGSILLALLIPDGVHRTLDSLRDSVTSLLAMYGVHNARQLVMEYSINGSEGEVSWAEKLLGDVVFVCPVMSMAESLSSQENSVYVYQFDHKVQTSANSKLFLYS